MLDFMYILKHFSSLINVWLLYVGGARSEQNFLGVQE